MLYSVENLSFKYPKNNDFTIKDISFSIKKGEIFGLLGPSGVGKSTTQKILIGLLDGFSGNVLYKGKELNKYSKEYYQEIGVGFEMPVHFSKLTAMENLTFFKKLYRSNIDIEEMLKRVGLYNDRHKKLNQFSKGMKIRLNFVRALLNNPSMLFLDEPTNGLDPINAHIIKEIIKEFKENGGTVLLTTHLMNDVDQLCDTVAFMNSGKIVEIDSPKSLKLKHGKNEVEVEFKDNGLIKKESFNLIDLGNNESFITLLKEKEIVTIHSKETSLDDIFILLSGGNRDD